MPCFSRRNGNSATLWRQKACVRFAAGPWARSTAQRQRLRPPTHPLVAPAQDAPLTCHRNTNSTNRTTYTPTTVPSPEIRSDSIRSDPIRSTVRFCSSLLSSYFVYLSFAYLIFMLRVLFTVGCCWCFLPPWGRLLLLLLLLLRSLFVQDRVFREVWGSVALRVWGSGDRLGDLICWSGLTQFSACGFSSQGHVFVVAIVVVAA